MSHAAPENPYGQLLVVVVVAEVLGGATKAQLSEFDMPATIPPVAFKPLHEYDEAP